MSVVSALALAGVVAAVSLAAGVAVGAWVLPRLVGRRQRKATELANYAVAQMLKHTVDLAPQGIVVVDGYRNVVFINERAQHGELGPVHDGLLDDRAWRAVQRTLATGDDTDVDLSPRRRSPVSRPGMAIRGHVRRLADDSKYAVIFVDDQSEQARMEATRRDFVANVSHELKTPVGAMGVLAEALLESADDPETVRRFGEQVLGESKRLANMVGELIELSRLQGAEKMPNFDTVDIDTTVSEAISRYKVAADNADITIATDDPAGFEAVGNQPLLVTAVANLISNAIAYSPQGSTVSISRRRRGDNVEIAVTDRGIGIAPADQERVFERFFRVDKARSRATGGTGLGLAIVKHVAANHNGSIRLWSKAGTGSTFTLSVPARRDADEVS